MKVEPYGSFVDTTRPWSPCLPGIPAPPTPTAGDEVHSVLRLRNQLAHLEPTAVDVEPFEHGSVVLPVELFARLVRARLTLEELT